MKKIKKAFKVLPKKILSVFLAIATLFTNFMPLTTVFAITENERQDLVELIMRGASNITIDNDVATISYEGGYVTARGDNLQTDRNDNWNFGDHIGTMFFLYTSGEEIIFDFFPNENNTFEVRQSGTLENIDGSVYTMSNLKTVANDGNYDIDISFRNNNNGPQPGDSKYTIDFGYGDWHFGEEIVVASIDDMILNDGAVEIDGDTVIHLEGFDPETMRIMVLGNNDFATELFADEMSDTRLNYLRDNQVFLPNSLRFEIQLNNPEEPQVEEKNPEQEGNTTAIIRVGDTPGEYEEIRFNINDMAIYRVLPQGETFDGDNFLYNEVEYNYDTEPGSEGTIRLGLYTPANMMFGDTITINGVEYQVANFIKYDNRDSWFTHIKDEFVGFILTIPKAENNIYNIVLHISDSDYFGNYMRQFSWTNDERAEFVHDEHGELVYEDDEPLRNNSYLDHTTVQILEARYTVGGVEYVHNEEEFRAGSFVRNYLSYESEEYREFSAGRAFFPVGTILKIRVTPEYGYQITNIFTPGDGIYEKTANPCEYILYTDKMVWDSDFSLEISKVNNEVAINGGSVSAANINLPDGVIDRGTVKLNVSEINPTEEVINKFTDFAPKYNMTKYLNISLDKLVYNGSAEDISILHINNMSKKATISLKLNDVINADNIVIIHRINNGDNFEFININSYDKNTNTIYFDVDSFSEFAIATQNYTEIESIDVTLEVPISGEKINVAPVWDEEAQMSFNTPDKTPIATISEDAFYTIDATEWVNGTCSGGSTKCEELFNGTFQTDDYYYAKIYISSKEGYKLTLNTLENITVNGRKLSSDDGDEFFNVYGNGDETNTMFIVKIKTEKNTNIVSGDLNGNGKIDLPDIIIALKKYLGLEEVTAEDISIADMDDDGKLTLKDIISLLKVYLGIN